MLSRGGISLRFTRAGNLLLSQTVTFSPENPCLGPVQQPQGNGAHLRRAAAGTASAHLEPGPHVEADAVAVAREPQVDLVLGHNFKGEVVVQRRSDGLERGAVHVAAEVVPAPVLLAPPCLVRADPSARGQDDPGDKHGVNPEPTAYPCPQCYL